MLLTRALAILAAAALAGCHAGDPMPEPTAKGNPNVVWAPVPASSAPGYTALGTYPQLTDVGGTELINHALRDLVVKDSRENEKNYADTAEQKDATTATYDSGTAYVNSTIVSVMQPVQLATNTGGAGVQEYWVAGTWLLPDATEVKIQDLFTASTATWPQLGELARAALRAGPNTCTATSIDDPLSVVVWGKDDLYRTFAVSPAGLQIGFPQYAVAEGACGSSDITIPWPTIEPYLGPVGRDVETKSRA